MIFYGKHNVGCVKETGNYIEMSSQHNNLEGGGGALREHFSKLVRSSFSHSLQTFPFSGFEAQVRKKKFHFHSLRKSHLLSRMKEYESRM